MSEIEARKGANEEADQKKREEEKRKYFGFMIESRARCSNSFLFPLNFSHEFLC